MSGSGHWTLAEIEAARAASGESYHEFVHIPELSAGLYRLAAGAVDTQRPHGQDELYHVLAGRATFVCADVRRAVGPGDTLFVARGRAHHFADITEELALLVFFAPAYAAT